MSCWERESGDNLVFFPCSAVLAAIGLTATGRRLLREGFRRFRRATVEVDGSGSSSVADPSLGGRVGEDVGSIIWCWHFNNTRHPLGSSFSDAEDPEGDRVAGWVAAVAANSPLALSTRVARSKVIMMLQMPMIVKCQLSGGQ